MSKIKERLTYHCGEWIPESQAHIHIYDSQFMFGDAVFEMARTFNQKYFLLEEHVDRLFRSMAYLKIPITKTKEEVIGLCHETFDINKDHFKGDDKYKDECRVMINVSRGPLAIYREVFELKKGQAWDEPTWIVNVWPLSKTAKALGHFYDTGVNAIIPPQLQIPARFLENKVKNRSRMHYQVANLQVASYNLGNDVMPLLVDDDGFITESTGANFIIVKDNKLIVPELRNMLRGSSMMYIVEKLAPSLGIEVVSKNFDLYDVMNCDEAMFTGTFVSLLPCNRVNGHYFNDKLKSNPFGEITSLICNKWKENVGIDFVDQIQYWSRFDEDYDYLTAILGKNKK